MSNVGRITRTTRRKRSRCSAAATTTGSARVFWAAGTAMQMFHITPLNQRLKASRWIGRSTQADGRAGNVKRASSKAVSTMARASRAQLSLTRPRWKTCSSRGGRANSRAAEPHARTSARNPIPQRARSPASTAQAYSQVRWGAVRAMATSATPPMRRKRRTSAVTNAPTGPWSAAVCGRRTKNPHHMVPRPVSPVL